MRRPLLLLAAAACSAALLAPATATSASAAATDLPSGPFGSVLSILPPGSHGNATAADVAATGPSRTATGTTPANYADQLEMYDALGRTGPGMLKDSDLTTYYKDARLGVDDRDVVSTQTPRPGVTIKRDRYGVPHITGDTFRDVEYGAGYANIQDRMFLTDVLRHAGSATLAAFAGGTAGNIAMDRHQLQIAPYTVQEANAQAAAVADRYGAEGQKTLDGLDAMISGMNDAQSVLCPAGGGAPGTPLGTGGGPNCPAEYAALQKAPTPYTRADIVYIASLVGGIFGKGGGGEAANAAWYQRLVARYGATTARRVYDDLREANDPEAPVTSRARQPYLSGGIAVQPGNALPDLRPTASAPGTGSDAAGPSPATASPSYVVDGPLGRIDLGLRTHGMSNALLVGGSHTPDGHPTVVFGPQTGYYAPQLLVEQDLSGPGIAARGVSFAGTNLVVELGHGLDYAWSATSASNDIVDTVVERLCNTDGSPATVRSTGYLVDGACTPMQQYVHTETALPGAGGGTAPMQLSMLVLKTRHGVVQTRTTVHGAPVAVVLDRTTYGHEVDSVVGFARLQDPGYVHDPVSFQHAVSAIDYTFNWFYTDSSHIAYFSSGLLPRRSAGWNADLPRWGDRRWDDSGYLPFQAHVRAVDPSQGYLVSWNNKPAPGFTAPDNNWSYGPVYRSLALSDRVLYRFARGKITPVQLVDAMMDGGTVDIRGKYDLPLALDVLGTPSDATDARAVALLRQWVRDGAHRVDRARTGAYDHQAAVELMDVWWDPQGAGVSGDTASLAKDVLRPTLGPLVEQLPQGLDDHPRQGIGSSFNGVAWYGYVSKDLRAVLGRAERGRYSRTYCGSLAHCRAVLRASLHAAVRAALAAQKVSDPSQLTYDKTKDDIRAVTAGVVGVRPIDWQNRPTFQQVVHWTSHR